VFGDQLAEERRQHDLGYVCWTRDAHDSGGFALEPLGQVTEARHALFNLFGDREQRLGGFGGTDAVATAVEERSRQRVLERRQSPRYGRGVDPQHLCGRSDRRLAAQRQE
jgi:hypothetical protein